MYITNITDDYNDTLTTNITNDSLSSICTNNIEIVIPLITIIPCGMSLVCLISLMVYTLIKPLFNKKYYLSNINGEVFISTTSS